MTQFFLNLNIGAVPLSFVERKLNETAVIEHLLFTLMLSIAAVFLYTFFIWEVMPVFKSWSQAVA